MVQQGEDYEYSLPGVLRYVTYSSTGGMAVIEADGVLDFAFDNISK
ncbi:MAG: hypothetical protein LBL96_11600 [Clostridiales bacterium]|jgi:hypothetical protein|nr:hypothetical protein [Clostridiales bacterium]